MKNLLFFLALLLSPLASASLEDHRSVCDNFVSKHLIDLENSPVYSYALRMQALYGDDAAVLLTRWHLYSTCERTLARAMYIKKGNLSVVTFEGLMETYK